MHSTLAVAANGLPLGVVKAECTARAKHDRKIGEMPLKLFDVIRQASVESYVRVHINSERPC
jgi:hypothetical protein